MAPCAGPTLHAMLRWFLVVFLALVLINGLTPLLRRWGFGRLPGDLRFRLAGREWDIPHIYISFDKGKMLVDFY